MDNSNIDFNFIKNVSTQEYKDIDDVINSIKSQRRDMLDKIDVLEKSDTFESQKELAVLIRKVQYFDALLSKSKLDLEKIFFPDGNGASVVPDVLNWYQAP